MKNPTPNTYFKAKMPREGLFLQLDNMDEFIRCKTFANANALFVLMEDEKNYFAFMQQGKLIGHPASGFETIEDYSLALQNKFPDAVLFYEAKKEGYSRYSDFKLVKEAGISDARIFEKMKSQGYLAGYEEFNNLRTQSNLLPELLNPYLLYKYATEHSFNDFPHFKQAYAKGFIDAPTYTAASEKDFKNAADYKNAQQTGFIHGVDYYKGAEIGASDYSDYVKFIELEFIYKEKITNHDERVLVDILSKLQQGKKVSLNKLSEHLKTMLATFKIANGNMPVWFTGALKNPADISLFLSTNEIAKKFGVYDNEGEYFETLQINQRKVVLDGANVAHNSRGNDKSKPTVANIISVVKALEQKGFTEISVISDASLRHRIADKDRMPQLEALCKYFESPAEMPADVYLISYVKLHRCLLVTNDIFRDWKLKDTWVANNIDYYKLSFMIDGDKVIMPDLENVVAGDKVTLK